MLGLAFLAALELAVGVAQLTAQCEFVHFSPANGSDPIAYTAKCSATPGEHMETCSQLNLSYCLTNQDGYLRRPIDGSASDFTKTCPSCHVDSAGTRLYCLCERIDMSFNYTWVDLDDIILIQDGILACSTTLGKELSECPISQIGGPPKAHQFVA